MKKILLIILIMTVKTSLWCALLDHYKKEELILKAEEGFGEGNDWEALFYEPYRDMIVAPDGSIFVVNSRTHNIYKFNHLGKLVKVFGRKGKGPGDHVSPDSPSILDNKYLVVGEDARNRRFSLWDLDGNFVKLVRTQTSVFSLTALQDNRVAYYTYTQYAMKQNDYQATVAIVLKDITSGVEKILKHISFTYRSSIDLGKFGSLYVSNYLGEVFLVQTGAGNLAIGVSSQPRIQIYSPAGEVLRKFELKIDPIPVDQKYIDLFKGRFMEDIKSRFETSTNRAEKFFLKNSLAAIKKFDFSVIFSKQLPYYKEILVDSEGNFLFFTSSRCQKNCSALFQVYSKDGIYICETKLNRGKYQLKIDPRFKNICFSSRGIFAILTESGDEDENLRLIKVNYIR